MLHVSSTQFIGHYMNVILLILFFFVAYSSHGRCFVHNTARLESQFVAFLQAVVRPKLPFDAHCCRMSATIKHHTDRVKSSFVIFDIRTLWRSGLSVRVPLCVCLWLGFAGGRLQLAGELFKFNHYLVALLSLHSLVMCQRNLKRQVLHNIFV